MLRIRRFLLALAGLALFAHGALAATNVWTANYPQSGTSAGQILISGTATPDAGATLAKVGSAHVWLAGANGGIATRVQITVDATTGAWSATLTGLTSGQSYNIVVQVLQRVSGANSQTIATTPATASAK
jgi:hypothetical protein